jgi:hypothetical protein
MAVVMQIAMLLTPLAYLIAGPLVDNVFEPAVGRVGWSRIASLVGDQPGAGMGLMIMLCGATIFVLSLIVYAVPAIRHMEATLPDYQPIAQPDVQTHETPELVAA